MSKTTFQHAACARPGETLIDALHQAKAEHGELPPAVLSAVADKLGLPLSRVAGVATFYSDFNGMSDGAADLSFLDGGLSGPMFAPVNWEKIAQAAAKPEEIIPSLRAAGLCGRSGAAFPVADKWELVRSSPAGVKYIIANGSEGEGDTGWRSRPPAKPFWKAGESRWT